jgi:hypothetical protein
MILAREDRSGLRHKVDSPAPLPVGFLPVYSSSCFRRVALFSNPGEIMSSKKPLSGSQPARYEGVSRREFARRAIVATAAVAALPETMLGELAGASPESVRSGQEGSATPLSPASQAEAEGKVQAILKKYAARLNDEQKADLRRLVAQSQKHIAKLRAYSLDNSDQPATVLKPLMERPARPASAGPAQKPKT